MAITERSWFLCRCSTTCRRARYCSASSPDGETRLTRWFSTSPVMVALRRGPVTGAGARSLAAPRLAGAEGAAGGGVSGIGGGGGGAWDTGGAAGAWGTWGVGGAGGCRRCAGRVRVSCRAAPPRRARPMSMMRMVSSRPRRQSTILFQRVLDDAFRARGLQPWNQIADGALLDDRVDGDPVVVAQRRNRRPLQRRQQREHARRDRARRTFSMMPTRPCASIAALSSSAMFSSFVFFQASSSAVGVGDELRVRLEHGVDDPEPVGAQRRAGLGDLDDRVGERRRLDFGGAPRELDVDVDPEPSRSRPASRAPVRWRSSPLPDPAGADSASPREPPAPSAPCRSSASRRPDRPAATAPLVPSAGRVLGDPVLSPSGRRRARHRRRSAPSPARGSACTRSPDRRCAGKYDRVLA